MKKRMLKPISLILAGISLLVPAGLITGHYRADRLQSSQRVASAGRVLQTPCGPIQYTEFGAGPAVLVVHGTGGGYDQGAMLAQRLGGHFRWIAPSRYGYLGSPVPQGASSATQADAYACLLDALGIERVAVVAYSGGGPSSLLFALRYPERVTALAVLSAVSHPVPRRPGLMDRLYRAFVSDFFYWSFVHVSKPALLAALGVPLADQKALPAGQIAQAYRVLEEMTPMGARRAGLLFDMQQMPNYDAEQIRAIQAPTLVVHARNDTLVPFEQGEYTATRIAGAQLVALERGGHFALLFDPETQARVVSFLERPPRTGETNLTPR